MSIGGPVSQSARATEPAQPDDQRRARSRRHRRRSRSVRVLIFALTMLITAAVISAVVLGPSYQPIAISGGVQVTGQIRSQADLTTPPLAGQIYLPPQPAASGQMVLTLTNSGPLPVTVLSATLNDPRAEGSLTARERHVIPVHDSGTATYSILTPAGGTGASAPLAGAGTTLGAGQGISIRLPVAVGSCWLTSGGYVWVSRIWVRIRFGIWTRLVPLSWAATGNPAIIVHEAEPASEGGTCLS